MKVALNRWLLILLAALVTSLSSSSSVLVHAIWFSQSDTTSASQQLLPDESELSRVSARASLQYMADVMDQFHNRFPVYDDVSSAGNHFPAFAKIPGPDAPVEMNGSWTNNPRSGATAIRSVLRPGEGPYGGYYYQNGILTSGTTVPVPNFGSVPNAGINLTGATRLTFWARGERGGERVEFFMGGVGRNPATGQPSMLFPDSSPRVPSAGFTILTTNWQKYSIDLAGQNLTYVLGGFGWVASLAQNPDGAVFYLDDIQYELAEAYQKQRLDQPRFIQSYKTLSFQSQPAPVEDFDVRFRNTAYTYDNALALLAFLSDSTEDGLRRARLIGDALVYASLNDRSYSDGRLRSAYAAGDIALPPGWSANNRMGTASIPGYFDEPNQTFEEVGQDAIDTGNNAWAMIALEALYWRTQDNQYLAAARRLAFFIRGFRNNQGIYQGFLGGLENYPEKPTGRPRQYASTEHNLDVYIAFMGMYRLTGEIAWRDDAQHALAFVQAMWDAERQCYLAGTRDPMTRNNDPGQLPLDAQSWNILAIPNTPVRQQQIILCAEREHRTTADGFTGFDFNEDKDGVWFEGTAQMAVAYAVVGQASAAADVRAELRRAQNTPPFGDGRGIVAASHDGLSTGFGFQYHRRLHVGATAWNVFAQAQRNPFISIQQDIVQQVYFPYVLK